MKSGLASRWTRREFLLTAAVGAAAGIAGARYVGRTAETFIARVPSYGSDVGLSVSQGLAELGIRPDEVRGRRVLLKPNLVDGNAQGPHVNTHPTVVLGVAEAFLRWGAADVVVAEGSAHTRDAIWLLEVTGLGQALAEARLRFVDLNRAPSRWVQNQGSCTELKGFMVPTVVLDADWVVSLPKMKTHHWAGVTLSMKNMFGILPGTYYGWPKNVLHQAGIPQTILDIHATVRPHLCVVDGIIGMEGDGPLLGRPKAAGVLVMGTNPAAVDATCTRVMGLNPERVPYLAASERGLGSIAETRIHQRGETVGAVRQPFDVPGEIPAFQNLLSSRGRLVVREAEEFA